MTIIGNQLFVCHSYFHLLYQCYLGITNSFSCFSIFHLSSIVINSMIAVKIHVFQQNNSLVCIKQLMAIVLKNMIAVRIQLFECHPYFHLLF